MSFGDILLTYESLIQDTGNISLSKQHIIVEVFFLFWRLVVLLHVTLSKTF
jgi:hypothetical protein